ncbi:MAG: response regulator [Clostridiales bacterium]|jgi:CheY-like chemotaxis protein|nr:response regulator [Clostridiales bacterium]
MKNVLIITDIKNFFVISVRESMKRADYNVIIVPPDTDAINEVKERLSAVLVFADENLMENTQPLYFLKDKAIMEDIPVFAAGTQEELAVIKKIVTKHIVKREFLSPINVIKAVESMDSFIKDYNRQIKKKILVVDDSGEALRKAKSWLEGKYSVSLANSAAMAIKYLALNRPDLVLLDYAMPVVDGKQVLEMIRTEADFADIPVIFLTAKGDASSIISVEGLRPDGYLLKTMKPVHIIRAIDDFFEKKKRQM